MCSLKKGGRIIRGEGWATLAQRVVKWKVKGRFLSLPRRSLFQGCMPTTTTTGGW